jgi:hypothetical protein
MDLWVSKGAGLNPTWTRIIKAGRFGNRHENRELSFVGKST